MLRGGLVIKPRTLDDEYHDGEQSFSFAAPSKGFHKYYKCMKRDNLLLRKRELYFATRLPQVFPKFDDYGTIDGNICLGYKYLPYKISDVKGRTK